MNFAYLHIILNHSLVAGLPLMTFFLFLACYKKNNQMKKITLIMLCIMSISTLPIFFTGEPAADLIEDFPGVTEAVIYPHAVMAQQSLVICLVASALALSSLVIIKNKKINDKLILATIGISILGSMSLVYTANLGGQIRHTENRMPLFKTINK